MSEMEKNIQQILAVTSATKVEVGELNEKVSTLVQSVDSLSERTKNLEKAGEDVKWEVEHLKREINKKKLRFAGVPEGDKGYKDLEEKIKVIIKDGLKIAEDISIEGVRRQGKQGSKPRVVIVTLDRSSDRYKILQHKKNIGSNAQFKNVYINEELTYFQAKTETALRNAAMDLKKAHKDLKFKIRNGVLSTEHNNTTRKFKLGNDGRPVEF